MNKEPCLCGATDCPRCYPGCNDPPEQNEDAAYEEWRQKQIDRGMEALDEIDTTGRKMDRYGSLD